MMNTKPMIIAIVCQEQGRPTVVDGRLQIDRNETVGCGRGKDDMGSRTGGPLARSLIAPSRRWSRPTRRSSHYWCSLAGDVAAGDCARTSRWT